MVRFLKGARDFPLPERQEGLWDPPSLLFNGYQWGWGLSPGHVADQINLMTRLENAWSMISIPPHAFTVCTGTCLRRCTIAD